MTVDALTMYEETSFWARDYGSYSANPPLAESIQADVAIVGGGYFGLNSAREFKKTNPSARVVVLEANAIGTGPAGRNAGFLTTLVGLDPAVTKLRWGKKKAELTSQYTVKAVHYTKKLIEDNRLDCDFSYPGLIRIAYDKPQIKKLEAKYKMYEQLGVAEDMGLHWLQKSDLQSEFNSPFFEMGLADRCAGLMHPCKLIREHKRLCLAVGVEIYEQTPVTWIKRQNGKVVLNVPNGTVHAERVVLATNAYTHLLKGLRGLKSRQFAAWTSAIVTERLTEEQWANVGWSKRQGFEDARNFIHYVRPTGDGRILIGGQDILVRKDDTNVGYFYPPDTWQGLEAHLKRIFPTLRDVNVAYRWSGPVSLNADMVPEIGYVGDERIICWTGAWGQGVAQCHLNGRVVADLLSGADTELSKLWIVNRKAIRTPGRLPVYLAMRAGGAFLKAVDRWDERRVAASLPAPWPAVGAPALASTGGVKPEPLQPE